MHGFMLIRPAYSSACLLAGLVSLCAGVHKHREALCQSAAEHGKEGVRLQDNKCYDTVLMLHAMEGLLPTSLEGT